MRLTPDLLNALLLELVGTLLLVLGILGYVGLIEALARPALYLTCGALGLAATGIAMPRLIRALRALQRDRRPPAP
jgi:glycerol uptake facilitator-like aquaporin